MRPALRLCSLSAALAPLPLGCPSCCGVLRMPRRPAAVAAAAATGSRSSGSSRQRFRCRAPTVAPRLAPQKQPLPAPPPPPARSDREKFLALSGVSLLVIFFLTSVGATLFYALGLSMLLVGTHAALRVPGARPRTWVQGGGEGVLLAGMRQRGGRAWTGCAGCGPAELVELRLLAIPCPVRPCSGILLRPALLTWSNAAPPLSPPLPPADDLFLDDVPEAQQGGFLSLLTGGAKPVVATAIASAV